MNRQAQSTVEEGRAMLLASTSGNWRYEEDTFGAFITIDNEPAGELAPADFKLLVWSKNNLGNLLALAEEL